MGQVTVIIDKRVYAVVCGDGQEQHILELGRFLDEKIRQLFSNSSSINENLKLAMLGLFLADELADMKSGNLNAITPQNFQKIDTEIASKIDTQSNKLISVINNLSHK